MEESTVHRPYKDNMPPVFLERNSTVVLLSAIERLMHSNVLSMKPGRLQPPRKSLLHDVQG